MNDLLRFSPKQSTQDFLGRLEALGWPAAEAMMAYQEWRQFAFPEIRTAPAPQSSEAKMWALRTRVTAALEAMEGPEDWKRYTHHWPAVAAGKMDMASVKSSVGNTGPPKLTTKEAQELAVLLMEGMTPRSEAIVRLSSLPYKGLDRWDAIREVGMDWNDVWEVVAREAMPVPAVQDTYLDEGDGARLLKDAFVASGLASLSWPAATKRGGSVLALLGQHVAQANGELERQTGWSGQVLGQNGRVSLQLGRATDGCSGTCAAHTDATGSTISTRADVGWGPVAHEWLHALDNSMGQGMGVENAIALTQGKETPAAGTSTESKVALSAWKGLLNGLNQKEIEKDLRAELARQAVEGLCERHGDSPEKAAAVQEEVASLGSPGWSRARALARLIPLTQKSGDSPTLAALRAEMVMTEIELVAAARDQGSVASSLWIQFADRFDQNLAAHHRNNAEAVGFKGYFKIRGEQAAHSFESLLPSGSLISDVGGARSLRYPLPLESVVHKKSWGSFFAATRPWWDADTALRAPVPPKTPIKVDFVARLRARRNAAVPVPVEDRRPLAARPR